MVRMILSDHQWDSLFAAVKITKAYSTENLRTSVEGILWRLRTGAPWRDLPDSFGPWQTVYNRFNRWSKRGVWAEIFQLIKEDNEIDNEWNFMDGTYIKAHQHAAGGIEKPEVKSIGKSKGGNTSKVHMLCDAHGNPITFELTGGNCHDMSKAEVLLCNANAEHIIADKGYDAEYLRDKALEKGIIPHIPRKSNSKKPNPSFDKYLYRHRHLVENLFAKLKQYRAFATRYDKLTRNFSSVVSIGCLLIWLRL